MMTQTSRKPKRPNSTAFKFISALLLGFIIKTQAIKLSFDNIEYAANDFGGVYHNQPMSVFYPTSAIELSDFMKFIFKFENLTDLTVAARGNGQSTQGEALANNGVVIDMKLLKGIYFNTTPGSSYVDASAGELWKDVLSESIKHGFAPKSWTRYINLTVGGTLSSGGLGGQAFRHGPQIDNVLRLEVVTGKGDILNCSKTDNPILFHGLLGGFGQFGIITKARISLEPAPLMVRWIKMVYDDFEKFKSDQEFLISLNDTFDSIEGTLVINGSWWDWGISPKLTDNPVRTSLAYGIDQTLYFLEGAIYFNYLHEMPKVNAKLDNLTGQLHYVPAHYNVSDVSYEEFLNQANVYESKLKELGLWDIPHPWLNLLVPNSSIQKFVDVVFGTIVTKNINGPVIIHPLNKSTWNNETLLVTPEEDIFYLVSIQSGAKNNTELEQHLAQNKQILKFCEEEKLGVKQYLPRYATVEEWKTHFGTYKWDVFVLLKSLYNPLAILNPGMQINQFREIADDMGEESRGNISLSRN